MLVDVREAQEGEERDERLVVTEEEGYRIGFDDAGFVVVAFDDVLELAEDEGAEGFAGHGLDVRGHG